MQLNTGSHMQYKCKFCMDGHLEQFSKIAEKSCFACLLAIALAMFMCETNASHARQAQGNGNFSISCHVAVLALALQ